MEQIHGGRFSTRVDGWMNAPPLPNYISSIKEAQQVFEEELKFFFKMQQLNIFQQGWRGRMRLFPFSSSLIIPFPIFSPSFSNFCHRRR